jgi:hypothetical protein
MNIEEYLAKTLSRLETLYHQMQLKMEQPVFIDDGVYPRFRYEIQSDSLACYLKGVKLISTLNAALILLHKGYTQEIGALCRMSDDFCNEIFFLLMPQDGNNFSKDQIRFLEDFFKEELDKPDNPLQSEQKRDNVPVRKILSTFGKLVKDELNPSDAQELMRTIHQAHSGYVHGAYPHIMELFGGSPSHFHMSGMLGTPRIEEWRSQLIIYAYKAIIITVFVARKLDCIDIEKSIMALLEEFEKDTGSKPIQKASEMLRQMKRKST